MLPEILTAAVTASALLAAIVGTFVTVARDGYRRVPTMPIARR